MTVDAAEIERLRAALARADARRDALDAASRAISGLLEPDAVLQLIVDRVRVLVEARYAALGIVDAYGFIERFITSGISSDERERIGAPPVGHGLLGLIIRDARAYRIPEISAHPDRLATATAAHSRAVSFLFAEMNSQIPSAKKQPWFSNHVAPGTRNIRTAQ